MAGKAKSKDAMSALLTWVVSRLGDQPEGVDDPAQRLTSGETLGRVARQGSFSGAWPQNQEAHARIESLEVGLAEGRPTPHLEHPFCCIGVKGRPAKSKKRRWAHSKSQNRGCTGWNRRVHYLGIEETGELSGEQGET